MTFEPVMIEHRRDHKFVPRDREQKRPRCATCGRGKGNIAHFGTPKSLNVFASSRSEFMYLNAKKMWQERFRELLIAADLPYGVGRIVVEGELCFPDRIRRDQGNYRFIIEKSLGDCLTEPDPQTGERWLEDDDWSRYEFGGLTYRYAKGESWLRLILFQFAEPLTFEGPPPAPAEGVQDERLFA